MAGVVVIDDRVRRQIALAKKEALKNPVPMRAMKEQQFDPDNPSALKELRDRPATYDRSALPPTISVMIPFGYRAAYSVEDQPPGLCAHLSIGTEGRKRKGIMPNEQCVRMIAEEYGIPVPPNGAMWVEEYEPGEYAVNLVHVIQPREEGHA